jgi:hypothetical protein
MYECRFVGVFVLCISVHKREESFFLFRMLGSANIWHVLKPANRPDEPHHNDWVLLQYRPRTAKMEVMLWPLSDAIWRFCASRCKMKLALKVKVKYTLVQALRLCTGRTAHRGSRGIALLFHDHGTGRGWWVSVTPRPLFTLGKNPVPIVQEAVWTPRPVWTGAEYLTPIGIR